MRLLLLACRTLEREWNALIPGSINTIDVRWFEPVCHQDDEGPAQALQKQLDLISPNTYDAVLLGCGLCSSSLFGLRCPHAPFVIPRAHDCASLLLGSGQRYREAFERAEGDLWWTTPGMAKCRIPSPQEGVRTKIRRESLPWLDDGILSAYVELPEAPDASTREECRSLAKSLHREFAVYGGDAGLMRALLAGGWDEGRFLIVPTGSTYSPSFDSGVAQLCR